MAVKEGGASGDVIWGVVVSPRELAGGAGLVECALVQMRESGLFMRIEFLCGRFSSPAGIPTSFDTSLGNRLASLSLTKQGALERLTVS